MWLRIELRNESARPAASQPAARGSSQPQAVHCVHPGPPIDPYPPPFSSFPPPIPSKRKNLTNPFLRVVGRTSIILHFYHQSIVDTLADYTKVTGTDLSKNPFAAAIGHSNSPEAILELPQEREKAFKEYRHGDRRLNSCIRSVVKVIQSLSGILGEAVNLVSNTCHPGKSVTL